MKRICMLLALCLLLGGCAPAVEEAVATEPALPAPTVPPDGNPRDVTCKGTYTREANPDGLVARVADASLSNAQLQVWYWATAAKYRDMENGPDFSQPLDTQICGIDPSVNSWQQYFLREALASWHTAQALIAQGRDQGLPTVEAYRRSEQNYAKYMDGKPATKVLYGYNQSYQPNSMHQAYLDALPEQLDGEGVRRGYADAGALAQAAFGATREALEQYARDYNGGYMYFTALSDYIEPSAEEAEAFRQEHPAQPGDGELLVTFRQILLSDQGEAERMLAAWGKENRVTEGTFGDLAHKHSLDQGTAASGGLYRNVGQEQLPGELTWWLFDAGRTAGDTAILQTEQGSHILYFVGSTTAGTLRAEAELRARAQAQLLEEARQAYPIQVQYHRISLQDALGTVTGEELLYPDVAHERYPDAPLYLQQDFIGTRYNGSDVSTTGCGITTMAMLASYMTDDELTVDEMCRRYGRYGGPSGTSGSLFDNEPAEMGFYLVEKTNQWQLAREYMKQGYPVVVIQHKGFWTRGGHYLLLETMDEDGMVQVRDSNLYNYMRLKEHQQDRFPWDCIYPQGKNYWIFDHKVTSIPACTRCGTGNGLADGYRCPKCETALLRRGTYVENT